ncbi:uncharacterized protein LOC135113334 isoform X3 [Scylla paramamosain]|uniref:uncharacterized protein LOC135113334 isoform X3 n=1 Tax=Scylla paramamosain TaxID=85552 RepID=UPI00308272BA
MMEVKARNRNVLNQVCEVPGDPGAVVPQVSQSVCQSVTSPGGKVKQADHSCGPDQQSAWETMGQTSVIEPHPTHTHWSAGSAGDKSGGGGGGGQGPAISMDHQLEGPLCCKRQD